MPMPAGIRAEAIRRIANSEQDLVPRPAHTTGGHDASFVADQSVSDWRDTTLQKIFQHEMALNDKTGHNMTQHGEIWQNTAHTMGLDNFFTIL